MMVLKHTRPITTISSAILDVVLHFYYGLSDLRGARTTPLRCACSIALSTLSAC